MQPPPTHDYCQICKDDYSDYFKHIESSKYARHSRLNRDLFEQIDVWMGKETEEFEASKVRAEETQGEKEEISIVSKVQTDFETKLIGKFY